MSDHAKAHGGGTSHQSAARGTKIVMTTGRDSSSLKVDGIDKLRNDIGGGKDNLRDTLGK